MKNITKLLILAGLVLAVAFSGCLGNNDNGNETDNGTDNNTTVQASHFYKNATIADNDTTVRFDMTTNPSTGYGWTVTANASGILNETVNNIATPDMVGAAGTHTFIFAAETPGTVSLNFKYERSFEDNTTVEDLTYVIQVSQNKTVKILSVSSPDGGILPLAKNITLENNSTAVKMVFEENPATGYGWSVTETPSNVLNMTVSYFDTPTTDAAGASGIHTWEFAALKDGNVTLTFDYNRSFEENSTIETVTYALKTNTDETIDIHSIILDTLTES